jgi:hypothetical protein
MPETVTAGHLLMLLGLILVAAAIASFLSALRWRGSGHGLGTPGYARARTARRQALYMAVAGILAFLLGCFTPLAELALA